MQIYPAEQKLFNEFVNKLDEQKKSVINTELKYHGHSHVLKTPIINLMDHQRLAKEFVDTLPLDVQTTKPTKKKTEAKIREASVKQFELLMPQLLKNYNASVVSQGRD